MAHGLTGRLQHDHRYFEQMLDPSALAPAAQTSNLKFQTVTYEPPMDGNDRFGDCVWAEREHIIRLWNAYGLPGVDPTEDQTIQGYETLSGSTMPPGPGLVIADALEAWHAGVTTDGNVLATPAQSIQVHDIATIQACVDADGAVFCGVDLPANAMQQFDDGQPWTLEPGHNPAVDGHGVPIIGYDPSWLYIVTWAKVWKVSYNWWHWYGGEAWRVTPPAAAA